MISPFAKWYRTARVTVTNGSTQVVGVNTAWALGASIRQGDLFTIDGSKFYEVNTTTGTSSMTLETPYLEATQAGVSYSVIRNFAVIPASEIIIRCLETTEIWKKFQDQMYEWQTKPYNAVTPATVDFVGLDGAITTVKSIPQIEGDTNITAKKGLIDLFRFGPAMTNQPIDWAAHAHRVVTFDKASTLTFVDPSGPARLTMEIYRTTADPLVINFPANARRRSGVPIGAYTLSNTVEIFDFLYDGVNYFG
ncbi:hypothetical protein [Xanthomonas phage JGB6]|nr:hypothetical protein [Xanthomonas phage JGB6]